MAEDLSKLSCAYATERVIAYPELPPQRLAGEQMERYQETHLPQEAFTDAGVLSCPPPTTTITRSDHGSRSIGLDSLLTILVK